MSNNTYSDPNCDSTNSVENWVLFGVFLFLTILTYPFTKLCFRGIQGACGRSRFFPPFQAKFFYPVQILLCVLFIFLAITFIQWPCALTSLKNFCLIVLLVVTLIVVWIVTSRLFDYAELFLDYFHLPPYHLRPLLEAIRVTKLIALLILAIVFFSIIVGKISPGNQFSLDLFLSQTTIISFSLIMFLVPFAKDAVAGYLLVIDRTFTLNDWVEIDGTRGTITRMGLFAISIQTLNGTISMVSPSKFQECAYIVYTPSKMKVCNLEFALNNKIRERLTGDLNGSRFLLFKVETVLKKMDLQHVVVNYLNKKSGDVLDITFNCYAESMDAYVKLVNDSIYEIMDSLE